MNLLTEYKILGLQGLCVDVIYIHNPIVVCLVYTSSINVT